MFWTRVLLLVGASTLARCQYIYYNLPACGVSCVSLAFINASRIGCNSIDTACLCASTTFTSAVFSCVDGSCSASDNQKTRQAFENECAGASVSEIYTADPKSTSEVATTRSRSQTTDTAGETSIPIFPSTDSSETSQSSSSSSSGGLSTGAKIGIGVAVPVIALLVVGIFLAYWLGKRRSKKNAPPTDIPMTGPSPQMGPHFGGGLQEVDSKQVDAVKQPRVGAGVAGNVGVGVHELGGDQKLGQWVQEVHEVPNNETPYRHGGQQQYVELRDHS
ncbi:hypothetical protein M501DRAFT_1028189 [Patellaria atrata CBS 101060]|uniref:CFEM domain-containing protein n=1 Tax=Patellaria atrata CBS 101060 TaxID=1346257 RepID=A0A9P4SIX9_9PEZI|nr:hypothetical protein M501DRAFT_1028189 [Patellaria atrata CBS 101060]